MTDKHGSVDTDLVTGFSQTYGQVEVFVAVEELLIPSLNFLKHATTNQETETAESFGLVNRRPSRVPLFVLQPHDFVADRTNCGEP